MKSTFKVPESCSSVNVLSSFAPRTSSHLSVTAQLLFGRLVRGPPLTPRITYRWGTMIETRSSRQLTCLFRSGGVADIKRRSWAARRWGKRKKDGGSWGKRESGRGGNREGWVYKPQVRWMGEWEDAEKKPVRGEREKKKKKISSK